VSRSAFTLPCSIVALILTAVVALGETVQPGVIDHSNCAQVRDLLPEPVFNWVEKGDLTLALGEMRDEVIWEPAFMKASEANAGRYDVDADGGLVDRESGERPPHTYGFPFPHIDPADANAAIKIMWNTSPTTYKFGRLCAPFALNWVNRSGFERAVKGETLSIAYDFQPTSPPNPDGTETRDLFEALSPASVEGIAVLSWRYLDNRPDSVWSYVPFARRIREMTAANRSDAFLGSDLSQDDGLLWLGKHQSFRWKLAEKQDVLVPTVAPSYVRLVPGPSGPNGQEWKSPPTFPGARFGLSTVGWTGAPWLPTNMVWVKRPVWVVEGYPKDPYYNYGRQLFYIDRVTYKIYYKVIYTPSGEYWKTILQDLGIGTVPDGSMREVITAAIVAVDDRADHATYTKGNAPDFIVEYNSIRAQPEVFTVNGLLRLGK
jgi:Protein of unknown function (DUF1329)